eukprot:6468806-Amphidinium_carterae.1
MLRSKTNSCHKDSTVFFKERTRTPRARRASVWLKMARTRCKVDNNKKCQLSLQSLHLLMEIAMEGSTPSLSWTYKKEDLGGFLAGVARRRRGRESPYATSRTTLQAFKLKQCLPPLRDD